MLEFDPDKLWAIQRKKDISPGDLIQEMAIRPKTYGEWMTGEATPRASTIKFLAQALGVREQALLTEYADTTT